MNEEARGVGSGAGEGQSAVQRGQTPVRTDGAAADAAGRRGGGGGGRGVVGRRRAGRGERTSRPAYLLGSYTHNVFFFWSSLTFL